MKNEGHKPTTARDRVVSEKESLDKKIEKLENMFGKVKTGNMPKHEKLIKSLTNEQKNLMKKQLKIMKMYSHILKRRLDIWIEE